VSQSARQWPAVENEALYPEAARPREAAAMSMSPLPRRVSAEERRGRGATINPPGRFETRARERIDDGWDNPPEALDPGTQVTLEQARTIITRNDSPDLAFDRSLNPYRGCEHGCVYCFARPSHSYMGLSPGLDFERQLFAKPNAAALLARELGAPGYVPRTLAIGTNTDPYQPIERRMRLMRGILDVLAQANHPVGIVTKSALVQRDIDLLAPMAAKGLAKVAISVTTLDPKISRGMEPRAASPAKRLETIAALTQAGIPVTVLVAPIIPAINDHEIERILTAAREAGAREAGYVLLRLPHEVKDLVRDWLVTHHPDKARHVMSLVKQSREGKENDPRFGTRQVGTGPFAWMIGRRFEIAMEKAGFAKRRLKLRTDLFVPPGGRGEQLSLF
jgi:DNA repair photolyase